MSMTAQIVLGTFLLSVCALVHVVVLAISIPVLPRAARMVRDSRQQLRNAVVLIFGVVAMVGAHTVQIWLWAASFSWSGAFADFADSFYFATVTYTTVGYGDLVLGEGLRIYAAFASITGLLTFGISTAFLFAIVTQLIPDPRKR